MTFSYQPSVELLRKEIVLRGANQFPRPSASSTVFAAIRIPANDARGSARQLAADQSRRASQFVRYRVNRRVQRVAVRIAASAKVNKRTYSGDADRDFRQALAPGTPETIAADDRNLDPKLLLQLSPQPRRGTIGIHRQ